MQCALGLGAALNQEDIELGNNQWMKFNAEKNSKTENCVHGFICCGSRCYISIKKIIVMK